MDPVFTSWIGKVAFTVMMAGIVIADGKIILRTRFIQQIAKCNNKRNPGLEGQILDFQ